MANDKVIKQEQRAGDPIPMKTASDIAAEQQVIQASPEAPRAKAQENQPGVPKFNAKEFIKGTNETLTKQDEQQTEKQRIHEKLTKAFLSMSNFERVSYFDEETQELVGIKVKYTPDAEGKTVYDYANDPEVSERLKIVIADDDPQDGSEVDLPVSHYWINPIF